MIGASLYTRSVVGGVERSGRLLSEQLVRRGHEVTVLTRNRDKLAPREDIEGVQVVRMRTFGPGDRFRGLLFMLQCLRWIRRHRRRIDVLHAHQSYSPGLTAAIGRSIWAIPAIVKLTSSGEFGEATETGRLPLTGMRLRLLRRLDRLIAVSPDTACEFEWLGLPAERIMYVPNGVAVPEVLPDKERAALADKLGMSACVSCLFSGRLAMEKGLDTLLEAWQRVQREMAPGPKLYFLGEGGPFRSVEKDLRDFVENESLSDSVEFLGWVPDPYPHLRAADVFVLPSRSEGLSMALLEAMACGCAPLVSDAGGNKLVVEHGETGLVFPSGDVDALYRGLAELLQSQSLRRRLGSKARAMVQRKYAVDRAVDRYCAVYLAITEGNGGAAT